MRVFVLVFVGCCLFVFMGFAVIDDVRLLWCVLIVLFIVICLVYVYL